ncbi:MAG TPA: T9SS type A sorting domain-containing protein [Cytophagaceae bacterium]
MSNAAARTEAMASNNWLALVQTPGLNYEYTRAVSHVTKVLSNNYEGGSTRPWSGTGWAATADNQWHCWFDRPISWTMMQNYMNKFFPLYPEVNAAAVTAKVKSVFDAINGGDPISFRYEMAPVIDEFVLNMPYDDPMQGWLYSTDGNSGCGKGDKCIGPEVTLKALGSTTFCQGFSVELETIVGTGYTYQWTKDGIDIPNPNTTQNIFVATQSGTYAVKVTTSSGCTIESDCNITVTVLNCSNCSMTATASSTSNSCSGVPDGSVSVTLANTGADPVTYAWTGPVSGNTATMSNVPDGTYLVEVTNDNDPGCKAFATVTVTPNTTMYQQLNLSSVEIDCNTADLSAAVIDAPPGSCTYKLKLVHTGSNCYGFWDKSSLSIIAMANNNNLLVSTPRANGSGDCNHLDESITIPHNATLEIQIKKISGFNVNGPNFRLELLDSKGSTVWTYSLNGVTYSSPTTSVYSGTTSCNVPMPTYTMSWSPITDLSNIVFGTNTASARASVSATREYTIYAQHPTEAACRMEKTITVIRDCPGELPVEWLYFDAEIRSDKTVLLTWATLSETNADRFYIERSKDGLNFESIGSVKALGHSSITQTYQYIDGNPETGIIYYRIREVDKDGNISYSGIKKLELNQYSLFNVYPNPSHNQFFIESIGRRPGHTITITLEELTGKILLKQEVILKEETPYELPALLAPGIYILKITDIESEQTFKLVKQ